MFPWLITCHHSTGCYTSSVLWRDVQIQGNDHVVWFNPCKFDISDSELNDVVAVLVKLPPPMTQQLASGPRPPYCRGSMMTLRHITLGRTPLDDWSARVWDLYLTAHNNHNRRTSMPSVGFETVIPTSERPQTQFLDRAAAGRDTDEVFTYLSSTSSF